MENIIVSKTFQFSLAIISFCDLLVDEKKFVIANQLLRSGTSIGANVREAQNAESKQDFIHKMKIAAKEMEETSYWLDLCHAAEGYPPCDMLIKDCAEIGKILTRIIATSKKPSNNIY